MKRTLFIFVLALFALFLATPNDAKATLDLAADTALALPAKEPVFFVLHKAPQEAELPEAESVEASIIPKWPRPNSARETSLVDVLALSGAELSAKEGRIERAGILSGGASRL